MTQPDHGRRFDDESESEGPVVRDKRRIDPVTGQLRHPPEPAAAGAGAAASARGPGGGVSAGATGPAAEPSADALASEELDRLQKLADERTGDLQRLQAEYVNYRRRVDRDRAVAGELATAKAVTELLPVLDDIDRAAQHGELTGGFKAVSDSLVRALERMGVSRYGQVGDEFDPSIHEALMHQHSDDVDGPTCTAVLQAGFRLGERILRPARVAVSEPDRPAGPVPVEHFLRDQPAGDQPVGDQPVGDQPA